ncbi:MAG: hypothetical protein WDZ94_04290 [Patescibacteria group bacterium]
MNIFQTPQQAQADNLESDSYVIQFGNFNMTAGEKEGGGYRVTDTVGQTATGPYGEYGVSNYFVGGGFQYVYQIQPFFFQISKLTIDFDTLAPSVHATDSHGLTIRTGGAAGYLVYAYEAHPLRHTGGVYTIPDTTCDASDCDETAATVWTDQDVAGFGFNMSGDDIPNDFVNGNYFRQFADITTEEMQVVMSSENVGTRQSTVTYKAGMSGDQAAGRYTTNVQFVAVPGY